MNQFKIFAAIVPAIIFLAGCGASTNSVSDANPFKVGSISGSVVALCSPLPHVLLASTEDTGIVRSTDDGVHWEPFSNGIATKYISAFVVNPHGDVFATTIGSGVYRLLVGATSWTRIDTSAPKDALLRSPAIAVSAVDNALYAATLEHGVYRSTDNGTIWRNYNVGLGIMNINAVAVTDNNVVYVRCVGGGIFRHGPLWDEWKPINEGLSDPYVTTLSVRHTTTVLAGTRNGKVFLLDDGKSVWLDLSATLPGYYVTAVASSFNGVMLAGTKSGLYRFSILEQKWSLVDPALETVDVRCIDIQTSGVMFIGTATGAILKLQLAMDEMVK